MPNERVRALSRKPEDDFTDVVIRVTDETMAAAWKDLEEPIKESPDYASMLEAGADPKWAFDEPELRLLAGAFGAATSYLPIPWAASAAAASSPRSKSPARSNWRASPSWPPPPETRNWLPHSAVGSAA